MKLSIIKYTAAAFLLAGFTSCLDFDTPSDEFSQTEQKVDPVIYQGDADKLDIIDVSEEDFDAAAQALDNNFAQLITAQYYLLGGKDGSMPGEHQYQYVYNITIDAYAGYTTCDQNWGGKLDAAYSYNDDFCEGPYGRFLSMKNYLANLLNNDISNNIVEIKAIALLLFDYVAQENTDIYGAIPYVDHKGNKETNPFTFNKGIDIYASIMKNLDDIVAVFDNFNNRPDWYQSKVNSILGRYDALTQTKSIETWRRFANSLKLRMAMHLVKVMPAEAKKWAEEAVMSGVVESMTDEVGLNPNTNCFNAHPLKAIMSGWNDCRVNASFVSMLFSLDHPYSKYLLAPISHDLVNTQTGAVTPAGSAIVGLRAGLRMESSQQYYANMRIGYSQFTSDDFEFMPLYAMKWAEVDFLRAEGALRGWSMGGDAETFYERGIKNGCCGDRFMFGTPEYDSMVDDYLEVENPVDYKYVDPMDDANNMESVTKIGVAWNDADDAETKLEKIITQKYIAIFPYSYEAWTDMRRTGYPRIFPVLNPNLGDGSLVYGDLIRRQILPTGKIQAGIEDVQNSGLEAIGGDDKQATRVFWDTPQSNF